MPVQLILGEVFMNSLEKARGISMWQHTERKFSVWGERNAQVWVCQCPAVPGSWGGCHSLSLLHKGGTHRFLTPWWPQQSWEQLVEPAPPPHHTRGFNPPVQPQTPNPALPLVNNLSCSLLNEWLAWKSSGSRWLNSSALQIKTSGWQKCFISVTAAEWVKSEGVWRGIMKFVF